MTPQPETDRLLRFFKVLGEPHRLKIVGLLAQKSMTAEQIAAAIGVGASTASHHLAKLSKSGLVSARAEGYYSIFSLHTEVLTTMAKSLLQREELPRLTGAKDADPFEQKVMEAFTNPDGSIKSFPVQEKKFHVLLRYMLKAFEFDVRYPEKKVNEMLKQYHEDTARIRRAFVEYGFMKREGGGGAYWRV